MYFVKTFFYKLVCLVLLSFISFNASDPILAQAASRANNAKITKSKVIDLLILKSGVRIKGKYKGKKAKGISFVTEDGVKRYFSNSKIKGLVLGTAVKKAGSDFFDSFDIFGSWLVPGLVQYERKEDIKGHSFLGATIFSAVFILYGGYSFNSQRQAINSTSQDQLNQDIIDKANEKEAEAINNVQIGALLLAVVYGVHIYDWLSGGSDKAYDSYLNSNVDQTIKANDIQLSFAYDTNSILNLRSEAYVSQESIYSVKARVSF